MLICVAVCRLTHGGKAGLSAINATDTVLVGGADDGTLLFWDRRTGNLRASFHDTHPEAVTQVNQRSPPLH